MKWVRTLLFFGAALAIKRDERDFFKWRKVSRVEISPSLFAGGSNAPMPDCLAYIRDEPKVAAPVYFPIQDGSTAPVDFPFPNIPPPRDAPEEGISIESASLMNMSVDELVAVMFREFQKPGVLEHLGNFIASKSKETDKNENQELTSKKDEKLLKVHRRLSALKSKTNSPSSRRELNEAEDEIPTIDPLPLHPEDRDFRYIETVAETLSTVRSFYNAMECLIEYMKLTPGAAFPPQPSSWDIRAKDSVSLGECMCGSLRYGTIFDDKHWGICRWMDIFMKGMVCAKDRDLDSSCVEESVPDACYVEDEDGNGSIETDVSIDLMEFEELAEDGFIPRYLEISQISDSEKRSYYYLYRALMIENNFAKNNLCGLQDPIEEQFVPGWEIVKHISVKQSNDPLVGQTAIQNIPLVSVSQRNCDLLVVLRTMETDYEGKIFMTYNQHSPNITDSAYGGFHSGFYNVATDVYSALEDELVLQQECVAASDTEDLQPRVIITGHGFGAGVAQPLSQMISESVSTASVVPSVSAILFSAPATMNSRHIDFFNSSINVRSIKSDMDALKHFPCREIDSTMGQPLCTGQSIVPVLQEDGRFANYGEVNGRIEFDHKEIYELSEDDTRWTHDVLMSMQFLGVLPVGIEAFTSNQFQNDAFHYCSYACWSSSFCSLDGSNTMSWLCSDCNRFVDRSISFA